MSVPDIDRLLGMEVYATSTEGIGGVIKETTDDFIVEEVLVDGSKANVSGAVPNRVLGSSALQQRFLVCMLIKRNWDTFIAVKIVAKELGIDQNQVQFAGIKDAKALTSQYITLENVGVQDVGKVDVDDIKVHTVGYVRETLSQFYLFGNKFKIIIRHPNVSESVLRERTVRTIQQITEVGGISNFYGHQRFGTTRPITHLVGKALVQGNFHEAAMLFLANPSPYEHPASRQARAELQATGDFKGAQITFPKQLRFERLMLNHLAEKPDDCVGAFRRLPPKLQALFVQAHQSYLFNRFLSERLKGRLPLNEAIVGDFVVGVERSGLPLTAVSKVVTSENLAQINLQVKAGRLRVALPIVGLKQKLSLGVMGELECKVLAQEGVNEEYIWVNELSRVGGKGGLRTALTPLRDFALQEVISEADGFQAQLSFMLLRGSYATVLLREIIKPHDPIASGF